MARTMTIDTGEVLRNFVEELVESGAYRSNSEVIRESLRLMQEKYAHSKLNKLTKLLNDGLNSGDLVELDLDKFIKHQRKKHVNKKTFN